MTEIEAAIEWGVEWLSEHAPHNDTERRSERSLRRLAGSDLTADQWLERELLLEAYRNR